MDFGELVAEQAGAFSRAQAHQAGFSDYRIRQRLLSGEWTAVTSSVLRVSGVSANSRWTADWVALLAAGRFALLAGSSAARFLGMEAPLPQPCVVVPPARHILVPGARVLRERVPDEDAVIVSGAVVTCRPRTVVDSSSSCQNFGRSII